MKEIKSRAEILEAYNKYISMPISELKEFVKKSGGDCPILAVSILTKRLKHKSEG